VEWSGIGQQKIVVDWTVIRDEATAKEFSAQITEAPRAFRDRTSISGAIDFAMVQIARSPFQAARRTIDVFGDGIQNSGRAITDARDEALAKGVSINGLVNYRRNRPCLLLALSRCDARPFAAPASKCGLDFLEAV
jgi:uncharacterized protein DUF1194